MPSSPPRVLISVVNWNGGPMLARCVVQLREQTYPTARIVVVDNGSTDGSLDAIRRFEPGVTVIENGANLGYAGGHNVALRYGLRERFDYFWLLNFDLTLEPGTLATLVEEAERDPGVGAVSPMIYEAERRDELQFCGTWIDARRCSFHYAADLAELDAKLARDGSDLLLWGTALLLRRQAVETAGLLDERFFAYFEDLDLTDRINRAGFRNRVASGARIWHSGTYDVVDRPPHYVYFLLRNHYLYWKERLTSRSRLRHWRLFLRRTLGFAAELKDHGRADRLEACVCGFRDAVRGRYGPWDRTRRAPRWLHALLTAHPYALARMLEGRVLSTLGERWRRRPGRGTGGRA